MSTTIAIVLLLGVLVAGLVYLRRKQRDEPGSADKDPSRTPNHGSYDDALQDLLEDIKSDRQRIH